MKEGIFVKFFSGGLVAFVIAKFRKVVFCVGVSYEF